MKHVHDKKRLEILAKNIKQFREERHMSRSTLAKYVGVTELDIVRYEYCIDEPPATVLYNIAEMLNVNLHRIFMDDYEWFDYCL